MSDRLIQSGPQFQNSMPPGQWARYMQATQDPERSRREERCRDWAVKNKKRPDGTPFTYSDAWQFAKRAESPTQVWRPVANSNGVPTANSTGILTHDAWRRIDSRVIQVARNRLVAVADIESRGLTVDLGDLGTLVHNWHAATDQEAARVSMNAMDTALRDEQEYILKGVPVPVITKSFQFDIRAILASQRAGVPIESSHADRAAMLVADMEEDLLFNGGAAVRYGDVTINGLRTHPQRVEVPGGTWATASNILLNINTCLANLSTEKFYGPFGMYVAPDQFHEMKVRPVSGASDTAQSLAEAYDEIEFVKMAPKLAAGEAILLQLTSDVVEIGIAQDLTTIMWDEGSGMASNMIVMAAKVPILKAPDSGAAAEKAGWAHLTGI